MFTSSRINDHLTQLLPLLKAIAVQPVPPRTPFNLRATGAPAGNVLAWENVPAADGYEVQMSENGDFSSAPTIFAGNATAFADVHTVVGTKRWYRIRSYASTRQNAIVPSAWSALVVSTSGSGVTSYDQVTHTRAWQSGKRRPSAIGPRVTVRAKR